MAFHWKHSSPLQQCLTVMPHTITVIAQLYITSQMVMDIKCKSLRASKFKYFATILLQQATSSSFIIIRHAPCQCIALLATNSLHSDLSKASSIASSKVRLCRDRSLFKVEIQEVGAPNWPTAIALMDTSQNSPSVSCLVHSGQVAKQHESFFSVW